MLEDNWLAELRDSTAKALPRIAILFQVLQFLPRTYPRFCPCRADAVSDIKDKADSHRECRRRRDEMSRPETHCTTRNLRRERDIVGDR